MYKSYKSDYSNHVHQLVVSVSKHLYVTESGTFKYQKKPFEATLDRPESFRKCHIVHYLIRDHFSGLFYAEVADSESFLPIKEFLYRAWSRKGAHPLYGIPSALTLPKTVKKVWPDLERFVESLGIAVIDVTSGFQGGIRDIRTWDEWLRTGLYKSGYPPDYSEVLEQAPATCVWLNTSESRGRSKAAVWESGLPEKTYVPRSKEGFCGS